MKKLVLFIFFFLMSASVSATQVDCPSTTPDAHVFGYHTSYSTARSTSYNYYTIGTNTNVGQEIDTGYYYVYRTFLKFDTTAIPAGATITKVNMKLVCTVDVSINRNFDVQIVKQDWSAQDPISADNREAAFDACLAGTADTNIWRNTSGMSTNTQYTSGDLDTTWINKGGYTYYSLRGSTDKNNNAPTPPLYFEFILFATQEHATVGYRPILTVEYTPVFPTVTLGTTPTVTLGTTPTATLGG